jgi:NAD(P)-dependent dehydrogenase (short-subunit alcohol dehydrogenase family)
MSWLNGRVIFITGGGSGLGREVALQSAELGAKVAIMDTHVERLEATRADVANIAGDCLAMQSDVTQEKQVTRAIPWSTARACIGRRRSPRRRSRSSTASSP